MVALATMSAEATAYVTALRQCPDGAELSCAHKAILWCLADHHNRSTRRCDPSQRLLSEESCVPESSLKRALAYLERHVVLKRGYPTNQGRGLRCSYVFLALDMPDEYALRLEHLGKGVHGAPLFSPPETGSEGVQIGAKRGPEGVHRRPRYKEEPLTKGNHEPIPPRAREESPRFSQAERDTLDLKRFQKVMRDLQPKTGEYVSDAHERWLADTRQAAFIAGIAPARLVELLKQHFPEDPNVDELYPKGTLA
jgi:hypothetical protein